MAVQRNTSGAERHVGPACLAAKTPLASLLLGSSPIPFAPVGRHNRDTCKDNRSGKRPRKRTISKKKQAIYRRRRIVVGTVLLLLISR